MSAMSSETPEGTHSVATTDFGVRDRLLLAVTELTLYGIAVEEAVDAEPDRARTTIAARLRVSAPHGLGSYLFWVRADDRCADDARANAGVGLPLYTSGPEVERAVAAACAHHGLAVRPGPRAGMLLVGV